MIHLANISGGAASGAMLLRMVDRIGAENIDARFADVLQEHPDLYRFLGDLERVSGVKIRRISDGRNCWDVWMQEAMLTNPQSGGCLASYHLKKLPLAADAASVGSPENVTIYVGFGPDEQDRMARLEKAGGGWRFEYPLTWSPRAFRCDVVDELRARGIEPSQAYADGYQHDNCGGACILAGIQQWIGLLFDDRPLFLANEMKEQEFLEKLASRGRPQITILRDRRGGTTRNLSLRQLREEVESGFRTHDDSWRASSCSCVGDLFA